LAITTNPKNLSFSYRYLAAVIADNNDYTSAIKMLTDGLRVNPLDTDMLVNRAGYFTCQGKFALAISDYDLCLKHRPDTYEAWKYRANAKFASGDVEGAMVDYRNTMSMEPNDASILNNCGIALLALGQYETALEYFKNVLGIHSPAADAAVEGVKHNIATTKMFIKEKNPSIKSLELHFITDPVFEKDEEKKMYEVTQKRLTALMKAESPKNGLKKITSRLKWMSSKRV